MSGPIRSLQVGLDLDIRPGDLVRTLPSTVYARPSGTQRWTVSLREGTSLLVVRGPERADHDGSWRSYTVIALHDGQMLEVMLEDVQRVDCAQGPPTASSMGPPSKMW